MACKILVPWPGMKPEPPAVEARSPNHGTAREFPSGSLLSRDFSKRQFRNSGSRAFLFFDVIYNFFPFDYGLYYCWLLKFIGFFFVA